MRALLLGLAATSWIARRPPPRSTIGASRAVLMAAVSKKPKFPTRRPLLPKSIDWNGAAKQHSVRAAPPELPAPFTVLGIETSCDDTGVAVVRSDGTILGEAESSRRACQGWPRSLDPRDQTLPLPPQPAAAHRCWKSHVVPARLHQTVVLVPSL